MHCTTSTWARLCENGKAFVPLNVRALCCAINATPCIDVVVAAPFLSDGKTRALAKSARYGDDETVQRLLDSFGVDIACYEFGWGTSRPLLSIVVWPRMTSLTWPLPRGLLDDE